MNLIKDLDKKVLSEFENTLIQAMSEKDKAAIMSYARVASMISSLTVKTVLENLPSELRDHFVSNYKE